MKNRIAQKLVYIITLVGIIILMAMPVYATDPWIYSFPITITDTSGSSRTNLAVLTGVSGSVLNTSGYIAADGLNTNVQSGTSSIPYMMVTNQVPVFISSLPANGSVTVNLYAGYSPAQTSFPVLLGTGGYVTTADAAALELGSDFSVGYSGYVGDDATYINKSDAFALIRSGTDIVANVYDYTLGESATTLTAATAFNLWGANWVGQTFTSATAFNLKRVQVYLTKDATPTGDVILSIRATADNKPTGDDLTSVTIDSGSLATGWNSFDLDSTFPMVDGTTYAIVLRHPSGNGGANKWHWYSDNGANVYANGRACSSNNSGVAWNGYDGYDNSFRLYTYPDVSATVADGEYDIEVYTDSGNLVLDIDSSTEDTISLGGGGVPDTATDYVFTPTPYADYIKLTVSGTQVLWYQPNTMLTTTTLPDRSTGDGTQNGTITYGSNADITITFGQPSSYSDTSYNPSTSFSGTSAPDATMPTSWYEGTISTSSPLYGMFNNAASTSGIPIGTLYFVVDITLVIVLMLIAGVLTHSNIFMLLIGIGMIGISVNQGVIGGWAGTFFVIGTLSIVYLRRQM